MRPKVTYIKKLDAGYWHVRFGHNRFVQWPIGAEAEEKNVFGEPVSELAAEANRAVSARLSGEDVEGINEVK